MNQLTITVEVDDTIDPRLTDPEEVADALLSLWDINRRYSATDDPEISLVSAEWSD